MKKIKNHNKETIFIHLPAYREPELVPTIKSALENAEFPERIHFGICRQFNPEDKFDNVDEFRNDKRFNIYDMNYTEAKGLPYARSIINDQLLTNQDFVCQLDSHHRFDKNWDSTLLKWYYDLKNDGYNPLICGYSPYYDPFNDPAGRTMEPWLSEAACFYPFGTIFIRPCGIPDWQNLTKPFPARFLSGHFAFGPNKWAKEVRHDPVLYFSGEEINLTVRSFTSGYDLFHPHRVVIWHATMRTERDGILFWDDQYKRGDYSFGKKQDDARAKIRQLLRTEDNGFDMTGYDLGTVRTLRDYEKYAGINFKKKSFQKYTVDRKFPPNPVIENEEEWENSFMHSFYYLVNIDRSQLPGNSYDSILVAFDDEKGIGINSKSIDGYQLRDFITKGIPIHYEEMFLTEKDPVRVVYWAYNNKIGWSDRAEMQINKQ
jgi:uncharacterized protein (UPF0297 family)